MQITGNNVLYVVVIVSLSVVNVKRFTIAVKYVNVLTGSQVIRRIAVVMIHVMIQTNAKDV
jgi:hypothetical protein